MRVQRDGVWVAATVERLQPLLTLALPPLCGHSSSAVRAALAAGVLLLFPLPAVEAHCARITEWQPVLVASP